MEKKVEIRLWLSRRKVDPTEGTRRGGRESGRSRDGRDGERKQERGDGMKKKFKVWRKGGDDNMRRGEGSCEESRRRERRDIEWTDGRRTSDGDEK